MKSFTPVERHLVCKPSSRASCMKVSYVKDGNEEELTDGQEVFGVAGEALKGISEYCSAGHLEYFGYPCFHCFTGVVLIICVI